jgi:hypothetical protein
MPKSATRVEPSLVSRMFSGLMSRRLSSDAEPLVYRHRSRSRSVSPRTEGIVNQSCPAASPES